jgi:hypothetical protein
MDKIGVIGYVAASAVFMASALANLFVPEWFRYCYWDFGLIRTETFTDISDFSQESSLTTIQGDACGSLQGVLEDTCSNLCAHIQNFRIANMFLLSFSTLSIFATGVCIFLHMRAFTDESVRYKNIGIFMCYPFVFYLAGICIFAGVGDFSNLKTSGSHPGPAENFSLRSGIYYAFGNLILNFSILVFGLKRSKKTLLKKKA